MAQQIAVLHLIDNCTRCRGCQVACQRNQGLLATDPTPVISADDLTQVKAQCFYDSPPYVKYNCWHCDGPLCAGPAACPFGALKKQANGAITVDKSKCNTNSPLCDYQCAKACGRGGYPKIGDGDGSGRDYVYKCTLCTNADGSTNFKPADADRVLLPGSTYPISDGVPACVATCPNGALKIGYRSEVEDYTRTHVDVYGQKFRSVAGNGSFYWASIKLFGVPTTDPLIEDHVVPMFTKLLAGPAGKALAVPAIALGGLYALYQRKQTLKAEEA